jgi:tetratricopeptide (TPR) repeat protein
VELALAAFNEALRIDPQFAPAYASVSRVHIARAVHYREPPRRALEAARAAAKRGLELEPELFEGHLALADVRRMLEWDWRGAETAYVQAIALNPSQEGAHRAYRAGRRGRERAGRRRTERAVEALRSWLWCGKRRPGRRLRGWEQSLRRDRGPRRLVVHGRRHRRLQHLAARKLCADGGRRCRQQEGGARYR